MAKLGGKPWIPTEEELQKIESLAARGMEQQDIALCLGIHPSTLSEKKGQLEALNEAIKRGKAKGIAKVTNALLRNIDVGNVTAQIFYLKTQARWKENYEDQTELVNKVNDTLTAVKELANKCLQQPNK